MRTSGWHIGLVVSSAMVAPVSVLAGGFTLNSSSNRIEAHLEAGTDTVSGADHECRLLVFQGADESSLTMTETDCLTSTVLPPVADHWQFWNAIDRENAEAFTSNPAEYARAELWDGTFCVSDAITCYSYACSNAVHVASPSPATPPFSGPAPGTQASANTLVHYEFTRTSTFSSALGSETLDPVLHLSWHYEKSNVTSGNAEIDITMTIGSDYEITMKEFAVSGDTYVKITGKHNGVVNWSKVSSTPLRTSASVANVSGTIRINPGEYPVALSHGDVIAVDCAKADCNQTAFEYSYAEQGVADTISGNVPESGLQLEAGFGTCPCSGDGGGDGDGGVGGI